MSQQTIGAAEYWIGASEFLREDSTWSQQKENTVQTRN